MREPANQVMLPTNPAITRIGRALAICGPIREPITSPGAIGHTMFHATAPLRWWARADDIAVKTIDADEVPMASVRRCAGEKRSYRNTYISTGTSVKPPP